MYDKSFTRRGHSRSLRDACRKAFIAGALILSAGHLGAQNYPNGLSTDSVHPEIDSIFITQMRAHLDSIRNTEHRPTVALVLSGGGAKGAAHVGVKKLMDELQIPVDLICGTSMGGLMGGLMSLGYSCEYIDSLLRHQDWDITLSDKVDPKFIPYDTKLYKSKHLISIPFHYAQEDFDERIKEQEKYSSKKRMLDFGAQKEDTNTKKGVNKLSSSLPSGYVFGLNVSNLLSSFSVGYQDSMAFKDLPVPFYCVATDLVSCKAKNWGEGSIKTAMRSTMSIPGMFDPVRTQGMVLVDGGTRNNFPVDLARAMGADFVVGVDLSDINPSYSELNNIGDIASQFITMLGKNAFDKNRERCDIFVKPDLEGYNMLSFTPAAIDTMINRGRSAALAKIDEFKQLKALVGEAAKPYLNSHPATDIAHIAVQIVSIRFEGISDKESKMLQKKIRLSAGQYVNDKVINEAMSKLKSTGCFESVTYSLLGKDEPYELVFNCVKGPTHQLGFGLRADSEEWVSLLFNLGLNTHKLMGSKLDLELKVGVSPHINVHYMLDSPYIPTVNVEIFGAYTTANIRDLEKKAASMSFLQHRERVYISNIKWTRLNLKAGVTNQFYLLPENWYLTSDGSRLPEEKRMGTFGSIFARGEINTMNEKYYPKKGMNLSFNYDLTLGKAKVPSFKPTHAFAFNWQQVIPLGKKFAIIPDLHFRNLADNNGNGVENSLIMDNFVGGEIAGRYFEHQIPLIGVRGLYAARDHAAVLNLDLRINPVKDLYVSAKGSYFRDSDKFTTLFSSLDPTFVGAAAEIGYDSIIGPLRGEVTWSGLTNKIGYYLSMGFEF